MDPANITWCRNVNTSTTLLHIPHRPSAATRCTCREHTPLDDLSSAVKAFISIRFSGRFRLRPVSPWSFCSGAMWRQRGGGPNLSKDSRVRIQEINILPYRQMRECDTPIIHTLNDATRRKIAWRHLQITVEASVEAFRQCWWRTVNVYMNSLIGIWWLWSETKAALLLRQMWK